MLGIPGRSYHRHKGSGEALKPAQADSTLRVGRVLQEARQVFEVRHMLESAMIRRAAAELSLKSVPTTILLGSLLMGVSRLVPAAPADSGGGGALGQAGPPRACVALL